MKKRNYHLTRRRTCRKKESLTDINFDIKFHCEKCGSELLFWVDGMEHEIFGFKCDKCDEINPLTDFFIQHEDEIKKEIARLYGNNPDYSFFDPQEEFNKRLFEAGFKRDKLVLGDNMIPDNERILVH